MILKPHGIIPGFHLSLGFTILYLSLILFIPLVLLVLSISGVSWFEFWKIVTAPRVLASYRLSIGASLTAAFANAFFGLLIAWVLVRYQFPGKRLLDAVVDLPFMMPTAVAGIALTTIYAGNGWIGSILEPFGIKITFTPLGVTMALIFIGLPFVVRAIQPVLLDLNVEYEEAAASLGASRWQTIWRVILPELTPSWITGFTLAFARGLGEYGSVVFISGNMPMKTEITPLLIMTKLEQFDYLGATAVSLVLLLFSFILLFAIHLLQSWHQKRRTQGV